MISPQSVWGGPQDSLTIRDAGWIQIYVEDNQEILDMTIQAFKIAENKDVLLPINICYDGFYLSHMTEGVDVPMQEDVNNFLPKYIPTHVKLDPLTPMAVDPLTPGNYLQYYRELHMQAMDNAKRVIQEVNDEFAEKFGRNHFGLVEPYRMDDAEYVLVTLGSLTGSARVAVDMAREKGIKAGLIKIRTLRPFPKEEVIELLRGRKAIGVIDRNVSFGWHTGIVYQEIKSAISSLDAVPTVPFVGGLGGEDLTTELMVEALDKVMAVGESNQIENAAHWLINQKGR